MSKYDDFLTYQGHEIRDEKDRSYMPFPHVIVIFETTRFVNVKLEIQEKYQKAPLIRIFYLILN